LHRFEKKNHETEIKHVHMFNIFAIFKTYNFPCSFKKKCSRILHNVEDFLTKIGKKKKLGSEKKKKKRHGNLRIIKLKKLKWKI
jgi:hypothetical protein